MKKPIIGITLGDVAGIGPEVVAKSLSERSVWNCCTPWIYGPPGVLEWVSKKGGDALHEKISGKSRQGQILLRPVGKVRESDVGCGKIKKNLSKVAVDCVVAAVRDLVDQKISGLVTAPVHKRGIQLFGTPFSGHTEFLATLLGVKDVVMMMAGPKFHVALVTTHVSIRDLPKKMTTEKVLKTIQLFSGALKEFGIQKPRIGVAAFNPHGGEDGGFEEDRVIRPAIVRARRGGIDVQGPVSADTLFHQAYEGRFDGIVAMYHDQGLSPIKMVDFDQTVNVTLGLPFVRTSPDHGTAYDIAGKGIANPESMIRAIQVAARLSEKRGIGDGGSGLDNRAVSTR